MVSESLFRRRKSHRRNGHSTRKENHVCAIFEPLEERRLLSATNLLVSVFDSTPAVNGASVLRYDDGTFAPLSGGVATGDHGLGHAEGLAVAPDGSFFVSSFDTAQVLHYSNSGTFLNVLGANDANPAPLAGPAALAFGPNGHLYVGDLFGQAIYQFDTTSATQQYLAGSTLNLGYIPGGFTFAADTSHDLIVGGLNIQAVTRYDSNNMPITPALVGPASGYYPSSIVAKANGDLLIADFDFDNDAQNHHQVVKYDAIAHTTSQFINITAPFGTSSSAGDPAQPLAMMYDHDGNLLVGVSPDHNLNGAVLKFNINSGAPISTPVSNIGSPSGLAFIPAVSTVNGHLLFYKGSAFDDNGVGGPSHDQAIAQDKVAKLPGGGETTLANYTSYTKGINGLMVDLTAGGTHGSIVASDFTFRVSGPFATNDPNGTDGDPPWAAAAAPTSVVIRPGAGTAGSDRVEVVWADGAVKNTWLEVTVKADAHTGLTTPDIFYFGNLVGDSGLGNDVDAAFTNATDVIGARTHQQTDIWDFDSANTAGVTAAMNNKFDYNRDDEVDATDIIIARANQSPGELDAISIANPPHAPATGGATSLTSTSSTSSTGGDSGVTTALTLLARGSDTAVPHLPDWLIDRLRNIDLNSGPAARLFNHLAEINTPGGERILKAADRVADALNLDDTLLDSILVDLGLE